MTALQNHLNEPVAPGQDTGPAGPMRRWLRPLRLSRMRGLVSLVVFLGLWQFVSSVIVKDPLFLVGPYQVAIREWHAWQQGQLQSDLLVSGFEFIVGFVPSVVVGIGLGLLLGVSNRAKGYIDPVLNAWYATPVIALIPLFILWFGIGEQKTIVMVMVLVFITCTINTDQGIRSTDPRLVEAARSFGASRAMLFTKVRVPSALPFIITGIRLAVGRGLIGVVVGELYGSSAGVGYRILISSQNFDTAQLLGGVVIFAIAGVVLVSVMEWLERKVAPWRAVQDSLIR
jgi:NitT/TauT family transport system permease protein